MERQKVQEGKYSLMNMVQREVAQQQERLSKALQVVQEDEVDYCKKYAGEMEYMEGNLVEEGNEKVPHKRKDGNNCYKKELV